jgi:hypothetical protein
VCRANELAFFIGGAIWIRPTRQPLSGPPHETYMHGVVVRDGEHRGCLLACQRSRPQLFSRAVNIGIERLDIANALSCAINDFGGPSMYSTKLSILALCPKPSHWPDRNRSKSSKRPVL